MRKTKYNLDWDIYKAFCHQCFLKPFRIDGSGISQVKSHEKSGSHKNKESQNQRTFSVNNGQLKLHAKTNIIFTSEEQVIKAEIFQALHFVQCNYSFASSQSDNKHFQTMFPD